MRQRGPAWRFAALAGILGLLAIGAAAAQADFLLSLGRAQEARAASMRAR
ncbi:MAG TPA: hypothetical protein VE046_11965 [Steroidobacteraceae bacterium]|nr:hypothetical protein [Steroidobacteraceae bacterium]